MTEETFIDVNDTENLIPLIAGGICVQERVGEKVKEVSQKQTDGLIYITGIKINRFEICNERYINIIDGEIRLSCCETRSRYVILNIDVEDSCVICKNTCKSDAICAFYEDMRE